MDDVEVGPEGIRLGQLLKLAGLVDTGGEGKELIGAGHVRVNGEVEHRRGRRLLPGDVIDVGSRRCRVG
ncbi:MAG TPA: RNA-binding S4 domain-containing protein [Pilimelia sp.]|nr:RNA-binding S4 domain-containing protein [Pilimelia sp.]